MSKTKTTKTAAKKATKKIVQEPYDVRKVYLENRAAMLEDFDWALKEVQQDAPSVGGKICGMDFQQFSAKQVFYFILEQEKYAKGEYGTEYISLPEEKKTLREMVKAAKEVFGKDYQAWYADAVDNDL